MNKRASIFLLVAGLIIAGSPDLSAQVRWMVGGKLGLSLVTGGGSTDAGLQIGPTGEVLLTRNIGLASEFTINTQAGTPIIWANYFKYYFDVQGSEIRPYADGGFFLDFVTGGPFFGIFFGGGAHFPVAPNLYIPADIQLGPIFTTPARFTMAFTSGIRYI
ncbi:MAG: hypothetical protein OEV30_05845, partial [Ignavibacteria bacterium]|nr:hypothetical protein [Ignavibacteria bacterium]